MIGSSVLGGVMCVCHCLCGWGEGEVVQRWVCGGCCKNKKDYMNLLIHNIFTIMIIIMQKCSQKSKKRRKHICNIIVSKDAQ